jgi:hypothetical protein
VDALAAGDGTASTSVASCTARNGGGFIADATARRAGFLPARDAAVIVAARATGSNALSHFP